MKNVVHEIIGSLTGPERPPVVAPGVGGQTAPRVRALLNRLVGQLPDTECYLEVGVLKGATFISACLDHLGATAYACDNWSQFPGENGKERFFVNTKKFEKRLPAFTFYDMDAFELVRKPKPFSKPVGIYFYDGIHTGVAQYQALVEFRRFFADQVVVVIDDWRFPGPRNGSWRAIQELRPSHFEFWELPAIKNGDLDLWWNGLGVFYLDFTSLK